MRVQTQNNKNQESTISSRKLELQLWFLFSLCVITKQQCQNWWLFRPKYVYSYKIHNVESHRRDTLRYQNKTKNGYSWWTVNWSHLNAPQQYPASPHSLSGVFITPDVTIVRPFISLSWSYSEPTNTICFSSPLSPSFFFHFFFTPTSTINVFLSRLPLVLQRPSPGAQLSLKPSKFPDPLLLLPSTTLYDSFFPILPIQGFVLYFPTAKQWQ